MYLKKLKKIFCVILTSVIVFGCVGEHQAFCAGDKVKTGSETKAETEEERHEREVVGTIELWEALYNTHYPPPFYRCLTPKVGANPACVIGKEEEDIYRRKTGRILVPARAKGIFLGMGSEDYSGSLNTLELLGLVDLRDWTRYGSTDETFRTLEHRGRVMLDWCVKNNQKLTVRFSRMLINYNWRADKDDMRDRRLNLWQWGLYDIFKEYCTKYPALFEIEYDGYYRREFVRVDHCFIN